MQQQLRIQAASTQAAKFGGVDSAMQNRVTSAKNYMSTQFKIAFAFFCGSLSKAPSARMSAVRHLDYNEQIVRQSIEYIYQPFILIDSSFLNILTIIIPHHFQTNLTQHMPLLLFLFPFPGLFGALSELGHQRRPLLHTVVISR